MEIQEEKERAFPPFEQSLPMLLMRARYAALQHFRPLFAQKDLTEQQWRVIRALYDETSLDMSSLAKRCHILLPSLSGIIKRLEGRELISRVKDSQDQRSSLLSLTPKARQLIEDLAPEIETCYQEIERRLGKASLEQLYELLRSLEEELLKDVQKI